MTPQWEKWIKTASSLQLWLVTIVLAVVLTEGIVALLSWWLEGRVDVNHLLLGFWTSLLVAASVGALLFRLFIRFEHLNQTNAYLTEVIRVSPVPMAIKDAQNRIQMVNPKFTELFGYTVADIPTLDEWLRLSYPDPKDQERIRRQWLPQLNFADTQPVPFTPLEVDVHCRDGGSRSVLVSTAPLDHDHDGLVLIALMDVTEQRRQETALRIAATAFESQEGMMVTDANGHILKVNRAFSRITGYSQAQVEGRGMSLLKSGMHDETFYKGMWRTIRETGHWQGEIWNRRQNGEIYPEWLTITAVQSTQGEITHYVGTMLDITARKAVEAQVQHLAHHDMLTDLPNRVLLTDRLGQALSSAQRRNEQLAVLFLDLDSFKPVNDQLGHDVGDLLLQEVAQRLRHCVKRGSDTVARLGGDEFVVVLTHVVNESDAEVVAHQIIHALRQPFFIGSHRLYIGCSVGIALHPAHGDTVQQLLQRADAAMYLAKNKGRGCFAVWEAAENSVN